MITNMFHATGDLMTIELFRREKLYLVTLFGDIPDHRRVALFKLSKLPVQAGPIVMEEGRRFVKYLPQLTAMSPPPDHRKPRVKNRL